MVMSFRFIILFLIVFSEFRGMEVNKNIVTVLDQQRGDVEKMTVTSVAIATGLAVIPGDATTPAANKMADLSGYLLFVLCAIILEKYLLMIIWYLSLAGLIPIALVMFAIYLARGSEMVKKVAIKLFVFGIAIMMREAASIPSMSIHKLLMCLTEW